MNFSPYNSNNDKVKNMASSEFNSNSYNTNQSIQKKNTMEYDNYYPKDTIKSSQEMKLEYGSAIGNSDIKYRTSTETNEKYNNNDYSNNTIETNNKNLYVSNTAMNFDLPKLSKSRQKRISIENIKDSVNTVNTVSSNNNSYLKHFLKNIIPNQSKIITDYRSWKGNNYFIMNAIEGPCQFRPTLLTWCAMTIPLLLIFFFNFNFFVDELSFVVPTILIILYLIATIFLIIASFVDPGIIRRFNLDNDNKQKDFINFNPKNYKRTEAKIFQLGYIKSFKYCSTCGIIRPNRSTHCCDCNNCVERLDHHCPWIGNCAGKRNYTYFFIFLICLNILSILVIAFCITHIVKKVNYYSNLNRDLPESEKIRHVTAYSFCEVIISLYLIIYTAIMMCFITGLLFYHTRLVLVNSTTKEELKLLFKNSQGNPYKRNICTNIKNVLCPKTKKYDLIDILKRNIKEICDYKQNNQNYINNYKINNGGNELNEPTNEVNETNMKLNVNSVLLNDLANIESNNILNNINTNTLQNNLIRKKINNNYFSEKNYHINYDMNEMSLIKEPLDSEYPPNHSFRNIKNNKLLQEYLKTFGTGNPSNLIIDYKSNDLK